MAYHTLNPNLILGYHGCDLEVGERILDGEDFVPSENDYDWLGHGIYFWESNPERALHFAEEQKIRGRIQKPFVIGAVLSIPKCIDTTNASSIVSIQKAYEGLIHELRQIGKPVPQNIGLRKNLDCAVIMYLHEMLEKKGKGPIDGLRGLYYEGDAIYPDSSFYDKSHVQLCIRNVECIKAVFRHKFS